MLLLSTTSLQSYLITSFSLFVLNDNIFRFRSFSHLMFGITVSQYSTVVLTVVRVMIAKYRKSGIWGYRSSLTPEPVELK